SVKSTVLDKELMPTAAKREAKVVKANSTYDRIIVVSGTDKYTLIVRGVGAYYAGKETINGIDTYLQFDDIDWIALQAAIASGKSYSVKSTVLDKELMPTAAKREAKVVKANSTYDRIIVVSGTDKYTLIVRGKGAYYAGADIANGKTIYVTYDDIDWNKIKAGTLKEVQSTLLDNELMPTKETRTAKIVKVNTAADRIIIEIRKDRFILIAKGIGEAGRFYARKEKEYDGRIVLEDLAEKTFDGIGTVKAKPIFYYTQDNMFSYFGNDGKPADLVNHMNVLGWAIDTQDKIEGHNEWFVSMELTSAGKFVIARAYLPGSDLERAMMAKIPGTVNSYSVDIMTYENNAITYVTTYAGKKEGNNFDLGAVTQTFDVKGTNQPAELKTLAAVLSSIPKDLKAYFVNEGAEEAETQDVIKALLSSLEDISKTNIYAGRLRKTSGGTYITYRKINSPEIIAQQNQDKTMQINLAWDFEGQPTKSLIVWMQNLSDGKYKLAIQSRSTSERGTLVQLLENDDSTLDGQTMLIDLNAQFRSAQKKVQQKMQKVIDKPIEIKELSDFLSYFGVDENTPLVKLPALSYEKHGSVSGGKINVDFDADVINPGVIYLLPQDPLGRVFMEKRLLSDGFILTINMWHWQETTGAPDGVLPGSVSIRFTKGEGLLNRVRTSAEEIKFYADREDIPSQITVTQHANIIDFNISGINVFAEEQLAVRNNISEDIAAGRIQITLIGAQGKGTVVKPEDIAIKFGSIHFEINSKGVEYATAQLSYAGLNGEPVVLPSAPIIVAEESDNIGNSQQQIRNLAAPQVQEGGVESAFSRLTRKAFPEEQGVSLCQSGYLYMIYNGGFSISELYTPDGHLYKQAIQKTISYPIQNFVSNETTVYYDLRVPFLVPIRTTGAESGRLITLDFDGPLQKQMWKMDTGWKQYVPLLYSESEHSFRFYDATGKPSVIPTPSLVTLFSYKFFLVAIGIMVGWKLLKLFYTYLSGRNWQKHCQELERIRKDQRKAGKWTDAIEDANHDRMMKFMKVGEGGKFDFILDASSDDGNNIFMFTKHLMYGMRLRVLSIVDKTVDNVDLRGDHPLLVRLDEFCKSVSKFFGDHCSMAQVSLAFGRPGYIIYGSKYFRVGHSDTEVYDKLELYFAEITDQLDEILEKNLLSGATLTVEQKEEIYKELLKVIAPVGLSEESGAFKIKHCQKLLAEHNTEIFDRETPEDVLEILHKLTDNQKKSQEPLGPADYAKLKAFLDSFDAPRLSRSFVVLIIALAVALYNIVEPISLALSVIIPVHIVTTLLWVLTGYLFFETVFLLLFGGLAIRTIPYLRGEGMEKFKNKIAWRTLSISPVVSEMAYYLPDGLLQGLSVIALYCWASEANLAVFAFGLIPLVLAAAAVLLAVNTIVQVYAMRRLYHGTHRALYGLTGALLIASAVTLSLIIPGASSLGVWIAKTYIVVTLLLEAFANLVFGSSMFGVSVHRNFRPSIGFGRPRAMAIRALRFTLYAVIGLVVAYFCMPWFAGHFASAPARAIIGLVGGFGISSYLMHFGTWLLSCFLSTIFFKEDHGPMDIKEDKVKEFIDEDNKILMSYVAPAPATKHPAPTVKPIRRNPKVFEAFKWLYDNNSPEALQFFDEVRERVGRLGLSADEVFAVIRQGQEALWDAEDAVGGATGVPLLNMAQMDDPKMPNEAKVGVTADEETKTLIRIGFDVQRHVAMNFFNLPTGMYPIDTPIFLLELAARLAQEGLGKNIIFAGIDMWFGPTSKSCEVEYKIYKTVLEHLCGYKPGEGNALFASVSNDPAALKSAALSRLFFIPMSIQRKVRLVYITDRNANSLNLDRAVFDIKRMISHPRIPIMPALRNTTNIRAYLGCMSWLVEGGHGFAMLGLNDKMGSGWCNIMRVYDQGEQGYLNVMRNSAYPIVPMAMHARNRRPYWQNRSRYHYGLIGLGPHVPHQSEDIGDAFCQTHNAVGLGHKPTFSLSTAQALKVRETFSTPELPMACTRWSWGLTQTKAAYLYQLVNDYGPESVYERDCRTDVSRFYVIMPIAIIGLFLVPFGIIFDCLPFSGIGAALFFIGILFNQVSTLNGLGANIRACDGLPSLFARPFRFLQGVAGALAFAAAAKWLLFGGILMPLIFGIFGFFFTSAPVGFARWLSQRTRDMLIFAFRVGIEVVAQFISYEGVGLTFATSGGGGVFDEYKGNAAMARTAVFTAVFRIGVALTVCHLVAFLIGLDLTNALFLLPSIFFGVSMVIGPYVTENRPGASIDDLFGNRQVVGVLAAAAVAITVFMLTGSLITSIAVGLFTLLSFSRAIPNWGEKVIDVAGLATGTGIVYLVNRMLHTAPGLLLAPNLALNIAAPALFVGVFLLFWITLVHVLPGPSFKAVKLNNPISKHIWEPLRDKVAARIGKLIRIKELKDHPRVYRGIWEFVRFVIIGLAAFYIFAIVPSPDFFYMRLGAAHGKVTFVALVQALAWGIGFILAAVIIGRIIGKLYYKRLHKRYLEYVELYEKNRSSIDSLTRSMIEARLQQARIFFHQESYDYIRDCLENLEGIPFFVLKDRRDTLARHYHQRFIAIRNALKTNQPSCQAMVEKLKSDIWMEGLETEEREALKNRYRIPEAPRVTIDENARRESLAKNAVYEWLDALSLDISRKRAEEIINELLQDQDIRDALIQARAQYAASQDDNIIITFINNFIWNHIAPNDMTVLADVWCSEKETKLAFFFTMSQINKAAAKKTIDAQLENKAKGFLANAQTTEGVRTVRKQKAT
ncbi:MAG: hypothetical protein PHQ96_02625, partial [Candidatus Omnitrophica bacterium]|nr:hypothetical protein [Candidatus Omnitrophota bacterium]